ncbi:MAG TPA: aromatic amino acid lyase, partial [Vicinamibacteria bacterium]
MLYSLAPRMASSPILLDGNRLDLEALEAVSRGARPVALAPEARAAVVRARRVVDDAIAKGAPVYGVNTGFGSFSDVHIPADRLRELQQNLVRSHAAGVGEPLSEAETRALMLLRANVLAKGFSGIRLETLEVLVAMLNRRVHPVIPSQGSVGASGDL